LQLLDFFHRERNRELSARAIGDEIGLPRGNLPMRATLSRLIAELRVSGLVRATDDGRVPDYQFVTQLPDLSVPKTITPETILAFMRDLKRPLALGIIGDMLNIGRQDRSNRFHLSLILGQLTKNKQLTVNTEERMKIPVYQVA
jgi:hypothetical protein